MQPHNDQPVGRGRGLFPLATADTTDDPGQILCALEMASRLKPSLCLAHTMYEVLRTEHTKEARVALSAPVCGEHEFLGRFLRAGNRVRRAE